MSTVRILVVEDHEPFRRWVCSTLEVLPARQIVGEASDGLDAVRKAAELKPDLVVLDVGLPGQDGLKAARQILAVCPGCKILFLSQYSFSDAIEEALKLGAHGYVVKAHAGRELLTAVDAVCQGKRFVTKGVLRSSVEDPAPVHEVQFHLDHESFLGGFVRFIVPALEAGKAVIFVSTPAVREDLRRRLNLHGVDTAALIGQGRYIELDGAEALASFMVNGVPDEELFRKGTVELLATAARAAIGTPPRVAACGDCAGILWADGNPDGAIQVERLWDEVGKTYQVDILCCYLESVVDREQDRPHRETLCAMHSAVH